MPAPAILSAQLATRIPSGSVARTFCIALPVLAALIAGVVPSPARTIHFPDDSRRCLSTSIAPNGKVDNASACIAHNSCSRAIFATFDAYPFHARRNQAPMHAKVSHWVGPGDREVFGWNDANLKAAPECVIIETHY
jgi:hypothetical protein